MTYILNLGILAGIVFLPACANKQCRLEDPKDFNKLIRDSVQMITARDLVFAYYTSPEIKKEHFIITADTIAPNKYRITANEGVRDDDEILAQKTVFTAQRFNDHWQVSEIQVCWTYRSGRP